MSYTLRDYQEVAVNRCIEYINSNNKKPGIVVAPTAAGKSWIIAETAKRYPNQILVLQPSIELLKQNYEKFMEFLDFYEKRNKEFLDAHSLNSPNSDDDDYGL